MGVGNFDKRAKFMEVPIMPRSFPSPRGRFKSPGERSAQGRGPIGTRLVLLFTKYLSQNISY